MSSVDYNAVLDDIKDALQAIAPTRVVTRTFKPFENWNNDDLLNGVFMIEWFGNPQYPVDLYPNELPRMNINITGFIRLNDSTTGEDLEQAQQSMIHDLEALAQDYPDSAPGLQLISAPTNGQLRLPEGAVFSRWTNYSEPA